MLDVFLPDFYRCVQAISYFFIVFLFLCVCFRFNIKFFMLKDVKFTSYLKKMLTIYFFTCVSSFFYIIYRETSWGQTDFLGFFFAVVSDVMLISTIFDWTKKHGCKKNHTAYLTRAIY